MLPCPQGFGHSMLETTAPIVHDSGLMIIATCLVRTIWLYLKQGPCFRHLSAQYEEWSITEKQQRRSFVLSIAELCSWMPAQLQLKEIGKLPLMLMILGAGLGSHTTPLRRSSETKIFVYLTNWGHTQSVYEKISCSSSFSHWPTWQRGHQGTFYPDWFILTFTNPVLHIFYVKRLQQGKVKEKKQVV